MPVKPAVLVVGAGPVGLALAADLLRQGVPCRIIDRAPVPSNLSKAVVLMPRTLEELDLRGMADEVLAVAQPMRGFIVYAEDRMIFHSRFERLTSRFNHLTCLGQSDTEEILRRDLARHGGAVEYGVELLGFTHDEHGVDCTLRGPDGEERLTVAWLAGCDGAHSTVRHGLGLEFKGSQYTDVWALADVVIDWRYPHDHACAFFHDEGYLAIFPMPGGRSRIFAVRANQALMGAETTLEQMQGFMDRWCPIRSTLRDPRWLAQFHVQHRQVPRYRVGRVFLAGDAAHIHSPESGLGMNTGIQDAYNLAWKLALRHCGHGADDLLESYHDERWQVGHEVVSLSNAMHITWAQFSPITERIRNRAFMLFDQMYKLHFDTVQNQCQLGVDYARCHAAMVEDHVHAIKLEGGPHAGRRILDCRVVRVEDDAPTTLFAGMSRQPARHHLLLLTGMRAHPDAYAAIREVARVAEAHDDVLDVHVVLAREAADALEGLQAHLYYDVSLEAHEAFAMVDPCLYLVRPDGYIALRSVPMRADDLRRYLDKRYRLVPTGARA